MNDRRVGVFAGTLLSLLGLAPAVALPPAGEATSRARTQPSTAAAQAADEGDPFDRQVLADNRKRFLAEKELRKLRLKYFGPIRKNEIRQAGIARLREYTDPAVFPALLSAFEREGPDVRLAVLDHLMDQASQAGDASLAWAAVFDADQTIRAEAAERVVKRAGVTGLAPLGVQSVIAEGLRRGGSEAAGSAAYLAYRLKLYEAIPMMIQAQAAGSGSSSGNSPGEPKGALAYIVIGRQTSFVADLTPVVGENAVGFDPTPGVITEGSVLTVYDAFVTVYHTAVYNWMSELAQAGWGGKSVAHLGRDPKKWNDWYTREFLPYRAAQEAAAAKATAPAQNQQPMAPALGDKPAMDPKPAGG
jgi:hypothetical protein